MKRVTILQYRLLHYRVALFNRLREQCAARNIELRVVHGQPTRREIDKKDTGTLPWADIVENTVVEVGDRDWLWQPLPTSLRDSDLVIVMQESRLLSNYFLLASRIWSKRKIAYWGHGANFQSNAPGGLRERWKKALLTKVDWWFAYTKLTADILSNAKYPQSRVTQLNNAIDTTAFKAALSMVPDNEIAFARRQLCIAPTAPVGIFCGSLYADKRLDFLVAACDRIREKSPEFHCVVLGDGPAMPFMREAAASRQWLHLLGVTTGKQKALYFRMADFMLNPGLVGLHIVDAFCGGIVMVTTSGARHSPEVCYLENNINGIITIDNEDAYANEVLRLIDNRKDLKRLQVAALQSSYIYTLENMVTRFTQGIENCLGVTSSVDSSN